MELNYKFESKTRMINAHTLDEFIHEVQELTKDGSKVASIIAGVITERRLSP